MNKIRIHESILKGKKEGRNERRKKGRIAYSRMPTNEFGRMVKLENHHFKNTMLILNPDKNHQQMLKLFSEMWWRTMFTSSQNNPLHTYKLFTDHEGKNSNSTVENTGRPYLNQVIKVKITSNDQLDIIDVSW